MLVGDVMQSVELMLLIPHMLLCVIRIFFFLP